MLRKLSLVAVAVAALGAAMAPTSASAWGWHGGWHHGGGGWHHGWGGWHHGWGWGPRVAVGGPYYGYPYASYGYGSCFVRRLVPTPWGPRWRLVNTCY